MTREQRLTGAPVRQPEKRCHAGANGKWTRSARCEAEEHEQCGGEFVWGPLEHTCACECHDEE